MKAFRHGKAENDRRFKVAHLPPNVLLNCLGDNTRLPGDTTVRISLGIPENSQILDRYYDPCRAAESIIIYNPAWPSIPLGDMIPELVPDYKAITVKLSEPSFYNSETIRRQLCQKIISAIENKTQKRVASITYDIRQQAHLFYDANGDLIDTFSDVEQHIEMVKAFKRIQCQGQ